MGIPRLTSTIQPYVRFDSLKGESIVIDGPGFAYHILYKCQTPDLKPPSYAQLGAAAVGWLDAVAEAGCIIEAVYFDGFLPEDKLPTRLSRASQLFREVTRISGTFVKGFPLSYKGSFNQELSHDFLFRTEVLHTPWPFPAPSFLVPAVIEALKAHSRYGDLVRIVPDEADAYCAAHLEKHGGVVFTHDSDLLIHDLGKGSVAFFRDIVLTPGDDVRCALYDPIHICQKVGIPSTSHELRRLAYERYLDPHRSLPQLLASYRRRDIHDASFQAFNLKYKGIAQAESVQVVESKLNIQKLDPRLSELALQYKRQSESPKIDFVPDMFLPSLTEHAQKASAWEGSNEIRALAYTTLNVAFGHESEPVREHKKTQNIAHKGRVQEYMGPEDCLALKERLSTVIRASASPDGLEEPDWIFAALAMDITAHQAHGKTSYVAKTLRETIKDPKKYIPWELVNLLAHVHAALYSLRMLAQTAAALETHPALAGYEMPARVPSLDQFPTVQDMEAWTKSSHRTVLLEYVLQNVETPDEAKESSSSSMSASILKRPFDNVTQPSHQEESGRLRKKSAKQINGNSFAALAQAVANNEDSSDSEQDHIASKASSVERRDQEPQRKKQKSKRKKQKGKVNKR